MGMCEHYEELISAFIDGALAEEDRAALMEHMSGCASCQAYFDDLTAIHGAMGAGSIQAPEDFANAVMARVRETPQEHPRRRTIPLHPWRVWAAAAACCAIVALGIWNFQRLTGTQSQSQPELPTGSARSTDEAEEIYDETSEEKWDLIIEDYSQNSAAEFEDDAAPDTPVDAGGGAETAHAESKSSMPAQSAAQDRTVGNDASDSDSRSKTAMEGELAPEPGAVPGTSADAGGGAEEALAVDGIMPLSLEGGEAGAIAGVPDSEGPGETALPPVVDYETAAELFGHELVPCTEDCFAGYSLHWTGGSEGQDVIYDAVNYEFSNGSIQVNRRGESLDWLGEDSESVVYKGETFFVNDSSREGYTSVQYYPDGENGLGYAACFVSEMEREEVFALILSLVIS